MKLLLLVLGGAAGWFLYKRSTARTQSTPDWPSAETPPPVASTQPTEPLAPPAPTEPLVTPEVAEPQAEAEPESGTRFDAFVEEEAAKRHEAAQRLLQDPLNTALD
jgi:hypothetical protein